jgi:superfamily II DNA helicase RecQ
MSLNEKFHKTVLRSKFIDDNAISEIVDEGHCMSEWGEDFRPEYSKLGTLRPRLPGGLPICVASATMPPLVKAEVTTKLGISGDHVDIAISNEKPNAALSVRTLHHPQGTYADLMTIFNSTITRLEDFPQTVIYVNSRPEAERIEEFLRDNAPKYISPDCIEFYHRFIDDTRKRLLEHRIMSGEMKVIIATDALGMVRTRLAHVDIGV